MQGPVPDQFNLIVTDIDATVAFHRKLGLTIDSPIRSGSIITARPPSRAGSTSTWTASSPPGTGTTAGGAAWGCSGSR
jgi:hypothetical protein